MQQLAAAIRRDIDLLTDRYEAQLRSLPGYDRLPEALRRDLEHHVLSLIAQCLDAADHTALVQYAQQRAVQWETLGLPLTWFQQALIIPEELLTPLITSVDASNFLWQALNRSQGVVWQMVAERAHQTEERFRSIVETSHSGVLITDDAFHLTYVNDELVQISGYPREELLGVDFRRLLDEESRRIVADHYVRRQRGEDVPPRYEVTFLRKDGARRYIEMSAVTLKWADGTTHTVAQVLDVSDQKQAEVALRENESKLRAIYEGSNDAIMLLNPRGFFDCNPQTLTLFGVDSKEAFTRLHPSDLSPAFQSNGQDSLTASQEKIMTAYQLGYNRFEWIHQRVDGQAFPAEVLLSAFEYGGEQVLQATVRDITARREAEAVLARERNLLRILIDALPDQVFVKDTQGRLILYNRADARAMRLTSTEEALGKTVYDLYPRELADAYFADDMAVIESAQPLVDREEPGLNDDGTQRWILTTKVPLQDQTGQHLGLVGVARDITARKQAEEALARSAEKQLQLTQRLRAAIEAADELMRIPDLDTVYRRAVELAREKLGVERCGLFIVDPSKEFLMGTYGTDDQGRTTDEHTAHDPIELHQTMALFHEQIWIVQDAPLTHYEDGERQTIGTGWVGGTAIRGEAGAIGVLYNDAALTQSPVDRDLQETLAVYCSMLGSIIERKRLELQIRESLDRRSTQVQTSVEVAQHVAAAPETGELFHRVVTLVKERFNYYHAQLFRYVPAEDAVVLITGYGEVGQQMLTAGHKLAMGRGVVGTAAATGQSILATDVARNLDWRPNPNLPDTKGELAVPIKLGSGDAESQAQALRHFSAGNYHGIAVAAIDPDATAQITRESLQRGKPVVAISIDLGQDYQTAAIISVEHEVGYLLGVEAGTWAKRHLLNDQPVELGVLTCRTLPNVVERERGILDGIQSVIGERATVVVSASAFEPKEATYLTEGWLRTYPDLNMIVAYNDATALGAYQAAQSAGWHDPDQFFIGGIDAVPEALDAIQQGGVYQVTVNQTPEAMGIIAVRTLVAAIKGLPVKPVNTLYCAPVNRSNAAEFSGSSRATAVLANQDIIPVEDLAGLDVSGLRLGLSVLTLANPFFATLADSAQQEARRLGVQLVINDPSRVLGVLDVQSDRANTLTDDDRLLLEGLCGQIAIAIESNRLIDSARNSERLMRTIIETVPDNLYVKNRQSQFILANKSVIEQLGCRSLADLVGKTDRDFYPPALAEKFLKDEQAIFESGQSLINIEEPSQDAQGRPVWRMTTKVFLYNEAGEIEGLVGLGRDITARKQSEVEREQLLREQQKRAIQLQTASEVSRAASSILNLDELLPQAAELIRTRFDLYYVGIFLLDEAERWAVLRAGTGEAGEHMLATGHQLKIGGNSMISQCVAAQQARIALDVGEEAMRFDNPLLPLTRSEMALPLVSRGRVIGAVTIQSDQPAAFSAEDIAVLQSLVDQISNAVENARLYQQAQAALQEVDTINRHLTGEAWDNYLHQQTGREVIWLTDDDAAAPAALPQLDESLTAGEITIEPDPTDASAATITAPILLRGQPIGALRLRTPLNEWDEDSEVMLADIAGHIAQAVENARLVEQTQRTAQRERTINEINARVRQSVDLDAILRTAVNELGQSLKAARVTARVGTAAAEGSTATGDGRGKTND